MELLNEKSEKLATRRTYKLLKAGLFHLLMEMPFEKISLTEICTRSLVPRSTFYRYFEDKHDLLCYCFQTFFDEANLEEDVLFEKCRFHERIFMENPPYHGTEPGRNL